MGIQMNSKKTRNTLTGIAVIAVIIAIIGLVYYNAVSKPHRELAKRIAELSSHGGTPDTIDGLRKAIALYEAQIELNVKEGAQTGVYWKILAIRLADRGMHRDALAALERAQYYNAADPTLMYLTGESASVIASNALKFSVTDNSEREFYSNLAETAYLRAIALDATYSRPLLGLGILYVFDQGRPADAIPYLQKYSALAPNDVSALFVQARALFMTAKYSDAASLYQRILDRSKDPAVRAEAQKNLDLSRSLINE